MSVMSQSQDKDIIALLQKLHFVNVNKIADSLQGSVWRATLRADSSSGARPMVIKVANQYLQVNSLGRIGQQMVKCQEDIISEAKILKFATKHADCPKSIIRFYQLLKTETDLFLFMEDGGDSLFDFVTNAHALIQSGQLDIEHWKEVSKLIFKQMLHCIEYLHSKNICHGDVSMENFLISGASLKHQTPVLTDNDSGDSLDGNDEVADTVEYDLEKIQIKLCDFGLATLFANDKCLSNKWCGKKNYKSPEVVAKKKVFRAKKNDIWCLGVTLFMMSTGNAPWDEASETDEIYVYMANGFMKGILKSWNLSKFVNDDLLDLFESIFQSEVKRISLPEIQSHSWLHAKPDVDNDD
eukprot:CAMPEP_0197030246 /NCGR_PEP_ID=MMETSP1384-20130603/9517_1 /TAXON_ID=29189 /ORGANISM="Ammonia sp." /LENGTH=353 /DNA_ID=CAMNT_0042459555 /DNA_START=42 /DNA_END=1103 /DNA_ORIENTATION=-